MNARRAIDIIKILIMVTAMAGCATTGAGKNSESKTDGKHEVTMDLTGTVWIGKDSDGGNWTFHFREDGALCYMEPGMELPGQWILGANKHGHVCNGEWNQSGNALAMTANGGMVRFRATINIDGDYMSGEASNLQGMTWTWTASKTNRKDLPSDQKAVTPGKERQ